MILNNSLSLMDENYFNFQLEMADLQTYHNVYSSALEIATESDNIFVKIKNTIVNFFKKIVNWIRGFFKKEVKETASKNTENKNMAKNVNKDREFPITVSGGDNPIYNISAEELKKNVNNENTNKLLDQLQTFKDFVNNAQTRSKEQLMHFMKNYTDGIDVTSPEFSNIIAHLKVELENIKGEFINFIKSEGAKTKLTPGGKINSQQELNKVINQCNDKSLEKELSDLEKNSNAIEKICDEIEKKVKRLSLDDKEIVKILNNAFILTHVSVNGYFDIVNIVKNVAKKNISTFNSLLKQLQ